MLVLALGAAFEALSAASRREAVVPGAEGG
jgi:hypothetical protein